MVFCRTEEAPHEEIFRELLKRIPDIKIIHVKARTIEILKNGNMVEENLKVKDVLKIADLMICPPYAEPHSYMVLEAMKFNVPTFVSNVGWLGFEFKKFPDFLIRKVSHNEITEKIDGFYSNQERFKKLNNTVRSKLLKKYNYGVCMETYFSLFNK